MCYYIYFSYYSAHLDSLGFNVMPSEQGFVTPEWVSENIIVEAPSNAKIAVVSLDTVPPADEPIWLEFYAMEATSDGKEN